MDRQETTAAFDDVFDHAIVFHGYAPYMRDYDVFIQTSVGPGSRLKPENLRYRFTHCVRATARTASARDSWKRSLDARLVDYQRYLDAGDLDGYVWGVNSQCLYPGFSMLDESAEAAEWQGDVGVPFFEARVETNGHELELVFRTSS